MNLQVLPVKLSNDEQSKAAAGCVTADDAVVCNQHMSLPETWSLLTANAQVCTTILHAALVCMLRGNATAAVR